MNSIRIAIAITGIFAFALTTSRASAATAQHPALVQMEANYILSCQYIKNGNSANGAINDVYGAPTWVVPRENALAILGLLRANECLNNSLYVTRADLAMTYLLRVQQSDGSWCDQYSYATVVDPSKSPTQTAEVMLALDKLGFQNSRYQAMTKAANFLIKLQDPTKKTGLDDGLVCGGLDDNGLYSTLRWASDNAFAYQAFKAASKWANLKGDSASKAKFENAAAKVLVGINTYLKDPASAVWYPVIDAQGAPVAGMAASWLNYAPQMLDVPAIGVGNPAVGEWIHTTLVHQPEGAVVWDNGDGSNTLSPGYSFQASLCWQDLGQTSYKDTAALWADGSGLHQLTPDANGVTGGWIDWINTTGGSAQFWERFIDTSFYYIAVDSGGYNFTP